MDVQIMEFLEGARQARGLAVVIDVFRAFSLEARLCSCRESDQVFRMERVEV